MEPLNCTVELTGDGAEIWVGSQFQTVDQRGRGEGARPHSPRRCASTRCSRAAASAGAPIPSPTTWSRRARSRKRVEGAGEARLDARGRHPRRLLPADVRASRRGGPRRRRARSSRGATRSSGPRSSRGTPFEADDGEGRHRPHLGRGRRDTPYAIPNMDVALAHGDAGVPVLWWRSVGHSHTRVRDGDAHRRGSPPRRARIRSPTAARCSPASRAC